MDGQPEIPSVASLVIGAVAGTIAVKIAILYSLTGIPYVLGVLVLIIALTQFGLRSRVHGALACSYPSYVTLATRPALKRGFLLLGHTGKSLEDDLRRTNVKGSSRLEKRAFHLSAAALLAEHCSGP
jgi:hypothetical protein